MPDLNKEYNKVVKPTDKELYQEQLERVIYENTNPDALYKKHLQRVQKEEEENTIDGAYEFNI